MFWHFPSLPCYFLSLKWLKTHLWATAVAGSQYHKGPVCQWVSHLPSPFVHHNTVLSGSPHPLLYYPAPSRLSCYIHGRVTSSLLLTDLLWSFIASRGEISNVLRHECLTDNVSRRDSFAYPRVATVSLLCLSPFTFLSSNDQQPDCHVAFTFTTRHLNVSW